jgi:hypothetical protein
MATSWGDASSWTFGLIPVLRLLACNAEHWVAGHLNAYPCDDDEYRAITRETIIRGRAGVIAYTPDAITVRLGQPDAPPGPPAPCACSSTRSTRPRPVGPATPAHHLPGRRTHLGIQQPTHSNFRRSGAAPGCMLRRFE